LDYVCLCSTMLALYLIGIGLAWWFHPSRRKAQKPWNDLFLAPIMFLHLGLSLAAAHRNEKP
jgi:uncharacterized membrane protein YhfC